jgi:hypothetical protein
LSSSSPRRLPSSTRSERRRHRCCNRLDRHVSHCRAGESCIKAKANGLLTSSAASMARSLNFLFAGQLDCRFKLL